MFRLIVSFFLFMATAACAEELYYLPDRPVALTSTFTIQINQTFPSFNLDGKVEQKVTAEVSVLSQKSGIPLFSLPYDLSFVLKGMHVDLAFNGEKSSQDLKEPGTSFFLSQLAEIVDKPIKLKLGSDHLIHDETGTLKKVLKEDPSLSSLSLSNFFNDILELPFALAGEKLALGKTFRRHQKKEMESHEITLEIITLDATTVVARVKGHIPPHKVDHMGLLFKGSCEGVVKWKRANPLICSSDMRYHYEGEMQIDDGFGTMEYHMQHKVVADGMAMP